MAGLTVLGGKVDAEGGLKFLGQMFRPGYAQGLDAIQRTGGANMSIDVNVGGGMSLTAALVAYYSWINTRENVSVTTANPTNPRRDIVVMYVDLSLITSATTNNAGSMKFMAVAGTPAGSPADPSDSVIQAAIGAGNPFIKLARIAVPAAASSIVTGNITDLRSPMALAVPYLYGGSNNTKGHLVPNVTDDTVVLVNAVQTLNNKIISSSGLDNPYKFSVYLAIGAPSLVPQAANTKIPFTAENYDTSSSFDLANYRFVAPIDGFYHLNATVNCATSGSSTNDIVNVYLYKNGTYLRAGPYSNSGFGGNQGWGIWSDIELEAGDYVEIFVRHSGNYAMGINGGSDVTHFTGHLISAT